MLKRFSFEFIKGTFSLIFMLALYSLVFKALLKVSVEFNVSLGLLLGSCIAGGIFYAFSSIVTYLIRFILNELLEKLCRAFSN